MFDRAAIRFEVYQRLNKSAATKGFYTDARCNSAIQEAMDYVSTQMMIYDEGWNHKIDYIDVEANQLTIPVPPHMEMIQELRYLVGNVYTPMAYDAPWGAAQWAENSGATSLPSSYRIIDNQFYFNPPIGQGGTKYLQVEYCRFPMVLRDDAQQIDPQFNRAMINFVIYRAATILVNMYGMKGEWGQTEKLWFDQMMTLLQKRNAQSKPITEFCG